jgi:hypothetical protein
VFQAVCAEVRHALRAAMSGGGGQGAV